MVLGLTHVLLEKSLATTLAISDKLARQAFIQDLDRSMGLGGIVALAGAFVALLLLPSREAASKTVESGREREDFAVEKCGAVWVPAIPDSLWIYLAGCRVL
jgi:hypothetical protein